MGFECAFCKAKRFKDITPQRLSFIENYFDYESNNWAKDNYPTWDDYRHSSSCEQYYDQPDITKEEIEFYKDNLLTEEYSSSPRVNACVEFWCSAGRHFDDFFRNLLGGTCNDYIMPQELTKEKIVEALKYTNKMLQNLMVKEAIIDRAFTYDDETEEIHSVPCDGVEVRDEKGNIRRVFSDEEWSEIFISGKELFEEETYTTFISLQATLLELLSLDLDEYLISYHSG